MLFKWVHTCKGPNARIIFLTSHSNPLVASKLYCSIVVLSIVVQSMPATVQGQTCKGSAGTFTHSGVLKEKVFHVSLDSFTVHHNDWLLLPCWGDLWCAYLSLCKNLYQCHYSPPRAPRERDWLKPGEWAVLSSQPRSLIFSSAPHTSLIGVLRYCCAHTRSHIHT